MNQFPRIHSLGTVNIIHHQEFFYQFHPFRTDFVGDSGVGKSIITDLLQLILIGSTEYSSSTQSKEKRSFQTLALKTTDNTDFGYAFINVETTAGKYVVLGTYIARNQNKTQAFIVQKSHDFDTDDLIPLDEPITVNDLEQEGKWLPIDDLDLYFNEVKDIGFKKFRQFKKYHHLLHTNHLLPLDITADHALKDYAKILQTFARKNINIKDGVDLKDFLFGRQWHNHFKTEFEKVVNSMEDDISTYRMNRKQLDRIERKQKILKNLYDLKSELGMVKSTWEHLQYYHLSQQKNDKEKFIQKLILNHFQSRNILELLKMIKTEKIEELETSIPSIKVREKTSSEETDRLKKIVDEIEAIKSLMEVYELTEINAIKVFYHKFNNDRVLYSILQKGTKLLESRGLTKAFEGLDHTQGLGNITHRLQMDIADSEQELAVKEALMACNDIDNPQSIVYWALENKPLLTVEQESMILHFQEIGMKMQEPNEAKTGNQYIPHPKAVIEATIKGSGSGFWADFGGIHTFFEYQEKDHRLFDGKDEATIKAKFREDRDKLKQQINELIKVIKEKSELQEFLTTVKEPQKFLEAWPQRDSLNYRESDLNNEVLNWRETQLNTALIEYEGRDLNLVAYNKVKKERDRLIAQLSTTETLIKHLKEFDVIQPGTIDDQLENLRSEYGLEAKEVNKPEFNIETYYADFTSLHNKAKAELDVRTEILQHKELLEDITNEIQDLELGNKLDIENEFGSEFSEEKLNQTKLKLDLLQRKYSFSYKEAIVNTDMVENDRGRLEQTEDFTVLVRHVMPAIFQKINFKESEVWDRIQEYMDDILHRNAEINKNKLVKVRDLMQELQTEIGRQTNLVRQVGNELKKKEMKISGDLKASLKGPPNDRIKVDWITQFLDDMPTINEGLWEGSIQGYLNEREQRQKVSIDDLIIAEYKRYTDHPIPQITIEQLLSPFSYYSLNYKIQTGSGTTNTGSTGQTYTAMALLCIAKLSMLKKDQTLKSDGLRFMSIDEAAGIGSNMDMLETIAKKYGYQILSLSIPLHRIKEGKQYIYKLFKKSGMEFINEHPVAIFSTDI